MHRNKKTTKQAFDKVIYASIQKDGYRESQDAITSFLIS